MSTTPISNHWLTQAKDHSEVCRTILDEADDGFEWSRLGRELGVAESEIDTINSDESLNGKKRVESMVTVWLRQGEKAGPGVPLPTWRMLYGAAQSLGYSILAEYIAKHYTCDCEECQPKCQQPDLLPKEHARNSSYNDQLELNTAAKQSKDDNDQLQQLLQLMKSKGMNFDKMIQAVQQEGSVNTSITENNIPKSQVTVLEPPHAPPVDNSQVLMQFLVKFRLNPVEWISVFTDADINAQDASNLEPQSKTVEKYQQVCKHVRDPIDKPRLLQVFGLVEKESRCQTAIQAALNSSKCRIETLSNGYIRKGLIQYDKNLVHDPQKLTALRRSDEFLLESCNAIVKDCLSEWEKKEYKHFQSYEEETEFFDCIFNTKHSASSIHSQHKSYASTCKIFYVPVASITLDESSLKLSKSALSYLEKIEAILNKTPVEAQCEVQFACETFFERFGSHVSYGPYQVGGIYWLKAYSEDFKEEELEEIKQLQIEAVNAGVASSSRIKLETGHAGGPSTASDVDAWKEELLDRDENQHDSKWIIIDQNPLVAHDMKNLVSIQKIVQGVSCNDFKISDITFKQLSKAREQISKIEAENAQLAEDTVSLQQVETTCLKVKKWLDDETDDELKQNVIDHLQKLVEIKNDQKKEFWFKFYLGQSCIQCYLRRVVIFIKNAENNESIKKTLQNVLIDKTAVQNLDFLEKLLIKWVYPPVIPPSRFDSPLICGSPDDIARFLEFINQIVNTLQQSEVDDSTPLPQITSTITLIIISVRSHEFSSIDSLLLIMFAIPFGYDISARKFKTHLTLKKICDFKMHLETMIKDMISATALQKQLFLFRSLIKRDPPFNTPFFDGDILSKHIEYILKMENLGLEIQIAFCKCQNDTEQRISTYDIVKLNKLLRGIAKKNKVKMMSVANSVVKEKPTKEYFKKFLKRLNCNSKRKKSLQGVLEIDCNLINAYELNEKNLIIFMTEKLKMSNYKCRSLLISQNETEGSSDHAIATKRESLIHPMDSMFVLLYIADNFLRQDLYYRLNAALLPVPLLYTDPLSGEVVFPLWALRSIVRAWKCKSSGHHEERLVDSMAPLVSFIRFSRLPVSKSSIANEVINGKAESEKLFFNHLSEGSGACRRFANGTLEACWYFPSGEEQDQFDDVIAFSNLRGNAAECPQQFNVICSLSFMCFVLICEEDVVNYINQIKKLNSMKGKVIFILAGKIPTENEWNKILTKFAPNCTSIHLDSMTEPSEIKRAIQRTIQEELKANKTSHTRQFTNELVSLAESLNIKIDEDNDACHTGKAIATKIMTKIKKLPVHDVKEHFTPLQGPIFWQQWASKNKEQYDTTNDKRENQGIETFNSKLNAEKNKIRSQQLKAYLDSPSDSLINTFIDGISDDSPEVRAYFLQWLKFYLDDRSRTVSASLREKSVKLNHDLIQQGISEEQKLKIQKELEINDGLLVRISFGIEHLFRELGQIYECVSKVDPSQIVADTNQSKLDIVRKIKNSVPKIAASVFLSGHPFEIVDGDAAHVPIVWVSAILKELEKQLMKRNSRVYVVSVLGNQSTGKSTLINTMFGVRFAVGAGRCTRGAFMQMIRVVNSNKTDYLIVVDTEGLNAPELMNTKNAVKHDNELATLVIGLADTTVVNISGENIAGGIRDILTTSVLAFLRMKQVDLNPSCQFVRHNVSAVAANRASEIRDLKSFQEALDEMTLIAAENEHCVGKYKEFNDVITYNYRTDLQDFPTLFYNPPMAPVNNMYCESARKLKSKLIDKLSSNSSGLQGFVKKFNSLWHAVLEENYVFSFRNALEFDSYTKLEKEYSTWSWKLKLIYVKWKDEMYEVILRTSTENQDFTKQHLRLSLSFTEAKEEILADMEAFFAGQSNDIKSIMANWQSEYQVKLEFLSDSYLRKASKYIQDVIQLNNAQMKHNEMKKNTITDVNNHFAKLISESEFAHGNKKFTEEEKQKIKRKFDEMWERLEASVKLKHSPLKQMDFNVEIENIICKVLPGGLQKLVVKKVMECTLSHRGRSNVSLLVDDEVHFKIPQKTTESAHVPEDSKTDNTGFPMRLFNFVLQTVMTSQSTEKAKTKTDQVMQAAQEWSDDITRSFKDSVQKFKKSGYIKVLGSYDGFCTTEFQKIVEEIDRFKVDEIVFSNEYKVDVLLEMGGYILPYLIKANQDAHDHHPLVYLESLKSIYEGQFEALCTAAEKEKAAAICLVDLVEKEIHKKLIKKVKFKLADDIKCSNPVFASKKTLVGEVMLDLLREDDFRQSWALHLTNVKESYNSWITEYVVKSCQDITQNDRGQKQIIVIAESEFTVLLHNVEEAAKNATKVAVENKETTTLHVVQSWLTSFQKELGGDSGSIHLDEQEVLKIVPLLELQQDDSRQKDSDSQEKDYVLALNNFANEFMNGLKDLQGSRRNKIIAVFDDFRNTKTEIMIQQIVKSLQENIAGCCEQCPFCKEQCERILVNHKEKHFCSLHRPQCLGRFQFIDTKQMALSICTDEVGGTIRFQNSATNYEWHPYKEYQKIYPDWYIPDESHQTAPYWKWFVHHHRDDITELFNFKPVDIPEDWKSVTKQDAEDDIRRRYFGDMS